MRPLSRLAALSALLLNACYPPGDGKAPPPDELYFPTGLALDFTPQYNEADPDALPDLAKPARYLYVVNSDFDLQYRSASMLSYDLDSVRAVVPKNCKTDADCCDASGACTDDKTVCDSSLTAPLDPTRGPSYYCVEPGTTSPCGELGARDEADLVLYPGRCQPVDPINGTPKILVSSVGIGAFATDVIWRRADPTVNPKNPSRLFVPVRGDSSLHWIDVSTNGEFDCGQDNGDDGGCDGTHSSGNDTSDNIDHLKQPAEPYALDATADGKFIALTNQTAGSVSLFHNDWASNGGPKLVSFATGLPFAPVGIAALPPAQFADDTANATPGFLVAYRTAAQVDLLRVRDQAADTNDATSAYTRYALRRAGTAPINANSLGFDSRGITIDDSQREQDFAACQAAFPVAPGECKTLPVSSACQQLTDCLRGAHQAGVFVASRAPASVLVGAMTADTSLSGTSDLPSFTDSIALTFGPSRVIMGNVRVPGNTYLDETGRPYALERRVFIVCFDSRRIFLYDAPRRQIDAIVSTGRGPYALAVDSVRGLAYLGHFTDSYLGVISLDQRFPQTYATIVASIGAPKAPRTSK